MAGTVLRVVKMQSFDFSNTAADQSLFIAFPPPIPAAQYRSGVLLARLHSGSIAVGGTLSVKAFVFAPTDEDPARLFIMGDADTLATASFGSTDVPASAEVGTLKRATFTDNFGGTLVITVEGKQGGTSSAALRGVISADLTLRE